MKNKNLISIIMFTLLITNVLAFAISSEYWEENPVIISPGETKQIQLILQNMAGTENIEAQGMITQGQNIAKIIGTDIYQIPVGQKTIVNIEINIPKDTKATNEKVILSFKTKSEGAGEFGLGASIEREIPVIIEMPEENKQQKTAIPYILTGVLLIIIIMLLIPRFKKKKKRK